MYKLRFAYFIAMILLFTIKISTISAQVSNQNNELPSVTLTAMDAKTLLRYAIAKTSTMLDYQNQYIAYYREYMQFEDNLVTYSDGTIQYQMIENGNPFVQVINSRYFSSPQKEIRFKLCTPIIDLLKKSMPNVQSGSKESSSREKFTFNIQKVNDSISEISIRPKELTTQNFAYYDIYLNRRDTTVICSVFAPKQITTSVELKTSLFGVKTMLNSISEITHYKKINNKIIADSHVLKVNFNVRSLTYGNHDSITIYSEMKTIASADKISKKNYHHKFLYQNGNKPKNLDINALEKAMPLPQDENFLKAYKEILQSRQN